MPFSMEFRDARSRDNGPPKTSSSTDFVTVEPNEVSKPWLDLGNESQI